MNTTLLPNFTIPYKSKKTYKERRLESKNIIEKYPDRIPVICERKGSTQLLLNKYKYLVPKDLTVSQFMFIIRKRLTLPPKNAIFLFCKNSLAPSCETINNLYLKNKDEDGFLYLNYTEENVFG